MPGASDAKGDAWTTARMREYRSRMNRVMDYVEMHLGEALTLDELASVAFFSKYHFHRLFRAIVGETIGQFILRLRLEKAAGQLLSAPGTAVTEIALHCGFSSSATFARAFREAFGMSASEYRARDGGVTRKMCKAERKDWQPYRNNGQEVRVESCISSPSQRIWRVYMNELHADVEVKHLSDMPVAYVRHVGPYKGDGELFERLFTRLLNWAGPRNLLRFPETQVMAVYHDNPEITGEERLRLSCCISVPPGTEGEGEVGTMIVPGGDYAVARFSLRSPREYEAAWNAMYGDWLPQSGYQPDDRVCFEINHNDPRTHPEGLHIVDICIPVRPL